MMTSQVEYDILRSTNKFLLEPENELARSYYNSLYREFAICDLKHYKSGNVYMFFSFLYI
jgi:protein FRA10AC1